MSRTLVLVRHAKSDYPFGVADHDRPLADRGERDAPIVGRLLSAAVPAPAAVRVLVSSAVRTQATWALARAQLGAAWNARHEGTEARIYEASADVLLEIAQGQDPQVQTLVLVGHNPGMGTLLAHLADSHDLSSFGVDRFRTSAIAVLDVPGEWSDLAPACRLRAFALARA